jgi:hypothetical protein
VTPGRTTYFWQGIAQRMALLILFTLALVFTLPVTLNVIRTAKARVSLERIAVAAPLQRDVVMRDAAAELTPPGPDGELYDLAAQFALLQNPDDLGKAESLTKKALMRSPARAESWARLAYIELISEGRLTDRAITYMDRSFTIEPAGYKQFMRWRLEFMFANWAVLPDPLQQQTLRSLRMFHQWKRGNEALKIVKKTNNNGLIERAKAALAKDDPYP